jgi:hypothetical protein
MRNSGIADLPLLKPTSLTLPQPIRSMSVGSPARGEGGIEQIFCFFARKTILVVVVVVVLANLMPNLTIILSSYDY